MVLKVADRAKIPSFIVMDVMRTAFEREAAGADVVHMEVGQPGFPAPQRVRDAAKAALDRDLIGYTESFGLPALRRRIAQHYDDRYGVEINPDRICLTAGSSAGFVVAFLSAFNPGDRVALADPGYPAYRNILTALGLEVVSLPVGPDTHFQPGPELLRTLAAPIDGLILANPSNPTGAMLDRGAFAALWRYCRERGIRIISDEIYHDLTYGQVAQVSAAEFGSEAIIINSFSKYYCMTGWRLGWLVLPAELQRAAECVQQNLFINAPTLSQHAAIAAFDCRAELDDIVHHYATNRKIMLDALPAIGIPRIAPADGAFYIYADVSHLTDNAPEFCTRLLQEAGIAVTPGVDFDPVRGHQTLRLSFARETAMIKRGMETLGKWLQRQAEF